MRVLTHALEVIVAKVTLRNISPLGDLDLPLIGRQGDSCLKAGEEFDVPADIAGRGPSVSLDDDGNEITDLGEGLLAQVGNFEVVEAADKKAAAKKEPTEPTAPAETPEV